MKRSIIPVHSTSDIRRRRWPIVSLVTAAIAVVAPSAPVAAGTDGSLTMHTLTPTEITHSGAVFNGTWQHSGCCNIAVFAVSASPTFDGPVYDYTTPYSPGQTLIIRLQIGGLGEVHTGTVSFDARSWTPDGTPTLNPATTYHVRFGVQNGADNPDCLWSMSCYAWAETVSFSTRAARAPLASTGAATAVDDTGATVTGAVTGLDATTTSVVEYSTSADLASPSLSAPSTVAAGDSPSPVSWRLAGLAPATTYFFRVVATNLYGTARGEIGSFTTTSAVGITIDGGASITTSRVVKVTLVAPAGATSVILSADGGFNGAQDFPVDAAMWWSFDDLGDAVVTRSLYARFSGPGVDSSRVYSDDIVHDGRGASVTSLGVRRVSASSLVRLARISTTKSARVRLAVAPTSVGRCRIQGLTLHVVRPGSCRIKVTVTPQRGRAVSRMLTITLG